MPQQKRSSSSVSRKSKRTKSDAESAALADPKDNNLAKPGVKELLAADTFMTRLEKLESVQEQIEKDRDNLRTNVKAFKKQNDALKAAEQYIVKLKKELVDKDERIKHLMELKNKIEFSNEASKLKALGFEHQVADKEKSNIALKKQVNELNVDIASKDKLITEFKEQQITLMATFESKDKLIVGLQRQVEALNATVKSKEKSLKESQNKQDKLNEQTKAYILRNQELMQSEAELRTNVVVMSQTNKELSKEVDTLKQNFSTSIQAYYNLKQWADNISEGWNAYKIAIEQKNSRLEDSIREKDKEIAMLQDMFASKERETDVANQTDNFRSSSQTPLLGFSPYFIPEFQGITAPSSGNGEIEELIARNFFPKPNRTI